MPRSHYLSLTLACVLLLGGLAGCGDRDGSSAKVGVLQTRFPGEITAGGGTSGEVLARAKQATMAQNSGGTPGIPQGKGGTTGGTQVPSGTGDESKRGQAPLPHGSVSGTPGIPEGAGGTPSGPAMGGTTSGAAGTKAAPEPHQSQAEPANKQP